ncbi:MAG: polysaccharide pyruvyl transferase family protein [bacterium]
MQTLFCLRPATRNIGNDIIYKATSEFLYREFGDDISVVNIPALEGPQFGGITAKQVFDANRLASGLIVGGGNLFENGQLTIDSQALDALRVPLMLTGLSHGRIFSPSGELVHRSDAMPAAKVRQLVEKSDVALVRDHATQEILHSMGCEGVKVGGCPTLFMDANPEGHQHDGRILISVRHPGRMSVAPPLQWRSAEDVRRLIDALQAEYGDKILLVCHDYADIEFAASFSGVPYMYYDEVEDYISALRNARFTVGYRLHAFLPCVAFGTPSIHLSYDERGIAMVETAGMSDWEVKLQGAGDFLDDVMDRLKSLDSYHEARHKAASTIQALRDETISGMCHFADRVAGYTDGSGG